MEHEACVEWTAAMRENVGAQQSKVGCRQTGEIFSPLLRIVQAFVGVIWAGK